MRGALGVVGGALCFASGLLACVAAGDTQDEPRRVAAPASFAEGLQGEGWRLALGQDGKFQIAWRALLPEGPRKLPRNQEFDMELYVLAADAPVSGAQVRVRGWMPDHGHGLTRRPAVSEAEPEAAPGRYRVSGMLLHMRGHWQIFFDIAHDGVGDIVEFQETL